MTVVLAVWFLGFRPSGAGPSHADIARLALAGRSSELRALHRRVGPFAQLRQPGERDVLSALLVYASTDASYATALNGVELCLNFGADPNVDGGAPLCGAAASDIHGKFVQALLLAGARPNLGDKWSPLGCAAQSGNLQNAKLIFAKGGDVKSLGNQGAETPLLISASKGDIAFAAWLIDHGAKVNVAPGTDRRTPLHLAAQANRGQMVRLLLRRGANARVRDASGATPFDLAKQAEATLALEAGLTPGAAAKPCNADLANWVARGEDAKIEGALKSISSLRDPLAADDPRDLLSEIAFRMTPRNYSRCQKWVGVFVDRYGANVDAMNGAPLDAFSRRDQRLSIVTFLINRGANLNIGSKRFPLLGAVESGRLPTVNYLLDSGAQPTFRPAGGNYKAIHRAAELGYVDIAKALLRRGAHIESLTEPFRRTPLHIAAEFNQPKMVKFLLSFGANTQAKDKFGWTPYQVAVRKGATNAARLLRNRRG